MSSKRLNFVFEIAVQFLIIIFILSYFHPLIVFGHGPATGGDTGSHFWPVVMMRNAWDQGYFDLRFWNPGNYYGEPVLIHYFPLPFILMTALSYVMGIENAFNLITFIGPLTLPLSVFWAIKVLKLPHPYPTITSLITLFFIFDESWSIYGGNILSTLAGQFAHSISINLFIVASAYLITGVLKNKISYRALILFSFVCLSHAFTFLATPVLFLIILLQKRSMKNLKLFVISGVCILLLSSWFIIPMIDNQKHNIAYAFVSSWGYVKRILQSYFLIIPSFLGLPFLIYVLIKKFNQIKISVFFHSYLFLTFFYILMFFIFPHIGLPDGRAIPHIYLYLFICFGVALSSFIKKTSHPYLLSSLLGLIVFVTISATVKTIPSWIRWNYTSWKSKPLAKDFREITQFLKGSLDDPRIAYENIQLTNNAGSIRAFEMLPYFSNRATTEGVYHQSTIVNNASFFLQSMMSFSPSCPFHEKFPCGPINFAGISDKMKILGVNQIVIAHKKVKARAKESFEVKFQAKFGPWEVFKSMKKTSLVEVITTQLKQVQDPTDKTFYDWFKRYKVGQPILVSELFPKEEINKHNKNLPTKDECLPTIKTKHRGFQLSTQCINKPHLIKFAYHSSWKTDDDSPYFKASPGFFITLPKSKVVNFRFADKTLWKVSDLISLFSWLGLFFFAYFRYDKHNEKN